MFKRILFSIDQSREAHEAAKVVLELVQTCQAKLAILSVVEPKAEATGEVAKEKAENVGEEINEKESKD